MDTKNMAQWCDSNASERAQDSTRAWHQVVGEDEQQHFRLDIANRCLWAQPPIGPSRCISLTEGVLRLLQQLLGSAEQFDGSADLQSTSCCSIGLPLRDSLSEREAVILRYLPTNLSAIEIAEKVHVSVHTVKTHLRHIYAKLGVHRRTEAIQKARQFGLMPPAASTPSCRCGRFM